MEPQLVYRPTTESSACRTSQEQSELRRRKKTPKGPVMKEEAYDQEARQDDEEVCSRL